MSWPRLLRFPLSRWISVRILALAIGTAVVVATCMWLRFAIWNATVMRRMPEAERTELKFLVAHPNLDNYRLLQLINRYYGADYVYPEIGNEDWLTLGVLLVCATPAIMALAWRMSRPVSRQFLEVAHAARQVARGDFSARAPLLPHVPQEFTELALDFNEMTSKAGKLRAGGAEHAVPVVPFRGRLSDIGVFGNQRLFPLVGPLSAGIAHRLF